MVDGDRWIELCLGRTFLARFRCTAHRPLPVCLGANTLQSNRYGKFFSNLLFHVFRGQPEGELSLHLSDERDRPFGGRRRFWQRDRAYRMNIRMINDVLRLKFDCGLSHDRVAGSLGTSKGVVTKYLGLSDAPGLEWSSACDMDKGELEWRRALPMSM